MEKILAGDTNDLNRGPILSINANFKKMVKNFKAKPQEPKTKQNSI